MGCNLRVFLSTVLLVMWIMWILLVPGPHFEL